MIHITQGHENSIGIEILINSLLTIPKKSLSCFLLHINQKTLKKHLDKLNFNYIINSSSLKINNRVINLIKLNSTNNSQTIESLESSISQIKEDDILLTLPSSKDEFHIGNNKFNGHTEYFRDKFNNKNISMVFIGHSTNVLLLTDHIPLKNVSADITTNLICQKIVTSVLGINKLRNIDKVYISGINPHCGENGLMGNEDIIINQAIKLLESKFQKICFIGPVPGDTMYLDEKSDKNVLYVFSHHDQGLPLFKGLNGFIGINTTFGLPFLRVSPDHGTAFSLYGKNMANYQGMIFLLNQVLKIH